MVISIFCCIFASMENLKITIVGDLLTISYIEEGFSVKKEALIDEEVKKQIVEELDRLTLEFLKK